MNKFKEIDMGEFQVGDNVELTKPPAGLSLLTEMIGQQGVIIKSPFDLELKPDIIQVSNLKGMRGELTTVFCHVSGLKHIDQCIGCRYMATERSASGKLLWCKECCDEEMAHHAITGE